MNKVEKYVKSCFKRNYVDVDLQKEIVSSINERIADYISKGKSEDEAFENAVNDIGDLKKLAEDQNKIVVEKEKIDFEFSIYAYLLVLVEMIVFYFASNIKLRGINIPEVRFDLVTIFSLVFMIYPISSYIIYKKKNSLKEISFNYKMQINIGLIGASAIAILLIIINYFNGIQNLWCFFSVIGVFNWPLGIAIYNRLYFKNSKVSSAS